MVNTKTIGFTAAFAIVGAMLLVTGCGGGGGGGGGTSFPTPTLPGDAVAFNSTNAIDGADAATGSAGILSTAAAAKGTSLPFTVQDAIDLLTDQVLDRAQNSQPVATGVTTNRNCFVSGSLTETSNSTATGSSGTITYSNCNEDGISIINGSFSFIATLNDPLFVFNIGGNLTFTLVADGSVITMVMNLSQTINTTTLAFTISQTIAASGVPIGTSTVGGFLVTTIAPFEIDFVSGVISGQMLIQGANGSQIRITVTAPNVATVEVDDGTGGGFVVVTTSYAL